MMTFDKTAIEAQALGNFICYYQSDLDYINNFQRFVKNEISAPDFCSKKRGSFYSFLIEYRVIRNFEKGKTQSLLANVKNWLAINTPDDVDALSRNLKQIGATRGKSTVLCSKILFLNNPWKIIPMDVFTQTALGLKENIYSIYSQKINDVRLSRDADFHNLFKPVEKYLTAIEAKYPDLKNIQVIRENRYIDKLLWTLGKEKQLFVTT